MFPSAPKTHHETRKTCPVWKRKHILIEINRFCLVSRKKEGFSNQPTQCMDPTIELVGMIVFTFLPWDRIHHDTYHVR